MDWETNGFWRFGIFTMQKQVPQCGWRAINLIGILLDEISISLIRCRIMCCHNANRQLCLVNCAWLNSKTQCTHYYASWILISFKKNHHNFSSHKIFDLVFFELFRTIFVILIFSKLVSKHIFDLYGFEQHSKQCHSIEEQKKKHKGNAYNCACSNSCFSYLKHMWRRI